MEEEKKNLGDQLKSHLESIQILVMEKTDLEGLLSKTQVALANKDGKQIRAVILQSLTIIFEDALLIMPFYYVPKQTRYLNYRKI